MYMCIRMNGGDQSSNKPKPGFVWTEDGASEKGRLQRGREVSQEMKERIIQTLKKRVTFAATWVDVEMITSSEVSQAEKEKCHIDIIYMQNQKK